MFERINKLVNAYIKLDPCAAKRLSLLAGQTIKLTLTGWGDIYITPHADGLRLQRQQFSIPDGLQVSGKALAQMSSGAYMTYVSSETRGQHSQNLKDDGLTMGAVVHCSPLLLMRIAISRDAALARRLQMQGDIQLVQAIYSILSDLDIDWEEQLSQRTGDVIAHQIGNIARGLQRWRRHLGQKLRSDVTEYLQEESGQLPTRQEVEDFFTDIYLLQQDVDRLAAKFRAC